MHEKPPWRVHLVPYSEHSSFTELQDFVGFLKPRKVVPTVGVSGEKGDASFHKMVGYFKHLCDNSGALRSFLGPMIAQAAANTEGGANGNVHGQHSGPHATVDAAADELVKEEVTQGVSSRNDADRGENPPTSSTIAAETPSKQQVQPNEAEVNGGSTQNIHQRKVSPPPVCAAISAFCAAWNLGLLI